MKKLKTVNGGLPAPDQVEGYIDDREMSRRLQRSLRSLATDRAAGRLPYYRFGGAIRYRWEEVQAYLAKYNRICRKTLDDSGGYPGGKAESTQGHSAESAGADMDCKPSAP